MRPLCFLSLFVCFFVSSSLPGAERPAPEGLSLEEVLAKVRAGNPALRAQATVAAASEGRVEQAAKRPNPTLSVSVEDFGGSGRARGGESMELTVQASQLIERGDKPARRVALAESERLVAAQELTLKQAETLALASAAFIRALSEQARRDWAADQLALAEATVSVAERRQAAAVASSAELARARAALAAARAEHARAMAACASAEAAAAALWGGERSEASRLRGSLRVPPTAPGLSELEQALPVAGSPRLALFAAELDARRAALALETSRGVGDFTLGGGVRRLYEGPDTAFLMGVSFPLRFRDDNSGGIREARTLAQAAEQSLRAAETELRAALVAAWGELVAAHAQADELRRRALPAAEEACVATASAHERGFAAFAEVADARRTQLAIRRDILEAESAYALALLKAEALSGDAFVRTRELLQP